MILCHSHRKIKFIILYQQNSRLDWKKKDLKIKRNFENDGFNLSNLEKAIDLGLKISYIIPVMWRYGNLDVKKRIQKMVFPDGILYDFEIDDYRTTRVNSIFNVISSITEFDNE